MNDVVDICRYCRYVDIILLPGVPGAGDDLRVRAGQPGQPGGGERGAALHRHPALPGKCDGDM